jgi:Lon protease-like protein
MQVDPASTPSGKDEDFPVPDCIPIFPLPNLVFFPKIYLPLHIFEPRYRDMVSDAASGGQCVGMALLKEGWEEGYYGNPPIYDLGCVGRLVSVQSLPDGRFNIVLQGLSRYEICEQFYDRSYRQARITLKPDAGPVPLEPALRRKLIDGVAEFLASRDDGEQWQGLLRQDLDDEALVNSLATYLDFTPLDKQLLMEADSLPQRARRLNDLILFKLDDRGVKGWG